MKIVLDTNEYIGALGVAKHPSSVELLDIILSSASKYSLFIPRTIVNEVRRNVAPIIFTQFIQIIHALTIIDEDVCVPFEIAARYESLGLKSADSFIAGYTEFVGAEILISENRHFLSRVDNLPFRVLSAERCLKLLH